MKHYSKYRSSGIEWIGEIPEHWVLLRFKYLAELITDKENGKQTDGLRLALENVEGFTGRVMPSEGDVVFEGAGNNFRADDVLFGKLRPYLSKVFLAPTDGICVGDLLVFRPKSDVLTAKFLFYRLLSKTFIDKVNSSTFGTKMPRASWEFISSLRIPFPSVVEQQAIASYLDDKTRRIDTLIEKKQRLIELLKEQRTAIINQAVTKGINPNVKMKDSGIEWIGEIPEHWEFKKIKHLLRAKKGALKTGPFGSQLKSSELVDAGFKVYNQRSVLDNNFEQGEGYINERKFDELREFEVYPNDVLITSRGTIGKCAVFPLGMERGILHPCLIRIQFNQELVSNRYVALLIQDAPFFQESVLFESNATTIEVIYGETLREVALPLPPMNEQEAILEYLSRETSVLENSIELARRQTALLEEYRVALISEAVTGKIDVRDHVSGKNN